MKHKLSMYFMYHSANHADVTLSLTLGRAYARGSGASQFSAPLETGKCANLHDQPLLFILTLIILQQITRWYSYGI
jgi:hypothetical protein